jgi:hypothetical protein
MDYLKISSVSYFTNLPPGPQPSPEETEALVRQRVAEFEARLRASPLAGDLLVLRAEYDYGCIITTLTLGAAVAGIYKFIKDYEKFRKGLVLLLKDLDGIRLRREDRRPPGSTWTYDDEIPSAADLAKLLEKAKSGRVELEEVSRKITWNPRKRFGGRN